MTDDPRPRKLLICTNRRFRSDSASCAQRGSEGLADRIEAEVASRGIKLTIERINCLGQCTNGAAMRLAPGGKFFLNVRDTDLADIVKELEDLCGLGEASAAPEECEQPAQPDELPLHLLGS
ncbi:MAG: (2Fe-2S) ferredoxin domain-containing protein [Magnetovibrionaceae bacterium]